MFTSSGLCLGSRASLWHILIHLPWNPWAQGLLATCVVHISDFEDANSQDLQIFCLKVTYYGDDISLNN